MNKIPQQLQDPNIRFLRVQAKSKKPIDKWKEGEDSLKNHLSYDDPKSVEHINHGGNVGVLGGYGNLLLIDCDVQSLEDLIRAKLPITLTEKSAKGVHFFFICRDYNGFQSLDRNEIHFGEVRADKGHQTVIAPSVHETGIQYKILDDLPIAEITREQLMETIQPLIPKRKIEWLKYESGVKKEGLDISKVINVNSFRYIGNGEYQGVHPVHGSETGINFCVNPDKNLWFCFRHNCGGSTLELIGILERKIGCGEQLFGVKFIEILKMAEEKYGFKDLVNKDDIIPEVSENITELNPLSENQLLSIESPKVKWFVEGLIPERSVNFLAGKRASYKSWGSIHLALGVANGMTVFGKFTTNKPCYVLYLDEENGVETLKERFKIIKDGMGLETETNNIGFLSFEGIKLEDPKWRGKLENFLLKHSPCVIIVDSFRRFIRAEENDATEINKVFTETIRPIAEKCNATWILLHHLRKGISGRRPDDAMDELRGSSELVNYADSVLIFERPPKLENKFILRQLKSRRAKESSPYIIELEWGENSVKFNCLGTAEDVLDAVELCCKSIMIWVEESGTIEFKTKTILEEIKSNSYGEKTISRALTILVYQGKLLRLKRGLYRVIGSPEGTEGQKGLDLFSGQSVQNDKDTKDIVYNNVPNVRNENTKGQGTDTINSDPSVPSSNPNKIYSNGV